MSISLANANKWHGVGRRRRDSGNPGIWNRWKSGPGKQPFVPCLAFSYFLLLVLSWYSFLPSKGSASTEIQKLVIKHLHTTTEYEVLYPNPKHDQTTPRMTRSCTEISHGISRKKLASTPALPTANILFVRGWVDGFRLAETPNKGGS